MIINQWFSLHRTSKFLSVDPCFVSWTKEYYQGGNSDTFIIQAKFDELDKFGFQIT